MYVHHELTSDGLGHRVYIQKFRDLRFQIPHMREPEAFSYFVARLNPEVRTQIGIHVDQNDLDASITMARKIGCYQHVEVGKYESGKGR